MGAIEFCHEVEGYSVREVFDALVEDAIDECGYGSYNGTISTCSLGHVKKMASTYSDKVLEEAYAYIDKQGGGKKWVASCLDLGVCGYDIMDIKKNVVAVKKSPVWKQQYVVFEGDRVYQTKQIAHYDKKADADKHAMELVCKDPSKSYIVIKMPVNVNNGDTITTEFEIDMASKENLPRNRKSTASFHRVIKEKHKYIFFGLASS